VRPAHCTALGKVLIAEYTESQLTRFFKTHDLKAYTPKSITEKEALIKEIGTVKRNGIAFDDGEFDAEARCVAVPVRDFTGQVTGAIGISGPIWRLTIQSLQEKAESVKAAAANLSRMLGYEGRTEVGRP